MSAVTTADCELLGRGPVQGSADSDSLAALVRQLCKQQQRGRLPGRRCTVTCGRDVGLEITPYHRKRPDDEGFESDEDLASLGSYEDPGKRKTAGTLAAVSVAAGAGSDSANSSGVSEDSDDADAASLKGPPESVAAASDASSGGGDGGNGRETYALADVAFCHTDASALPGVAVWVIKARKTSAGLEAIVVRSRDNRLWDVCRTYQEHSRRLKLEPKPWTAHANGGGASQRRNAIGVTLTTEPEASRYNLVQRTDTDGVTHIEVTAGPVVASTGGLARSGRDGAPSSIISISTPETPSKDPQDDDEDELGAGECPPQRPERRKYKAKPEDGGDCGGGGDFRPQQKVVRGQFIRVTVNHGAALPPTSPEPERKTSGRAREHQGSSARPTTSDRLWSTADYDRLDGRYEQYRSSSRSASGRTRSRSSGPSRRQQPLQLAAVQPSHPPPVAFSRYPTTVEPAPTSSFGTRLFGKLREMTSQSPPPLQSDQQPATFRRRNSVGETVTANFYQYFSHNHLHHQQHHYHDQYQRQLQQQQQLYQQQQQRQQAKNGGNLKSVIKKNNKSQPYLHAYDEPKKVTFSAYATVQVVD